ncbi:MULTISPECIES: FxsB family cyclophane-forming radical SAM/SPASM peptide maturase [unclassified Frankia]|uniref:FxsB family cyclophane-forming radical SAM/SPASM peptide maturase n=1 Tax=unclassified Frankia TaxID=2632575 RepID=UPI002024FE5C
MSPRREQQPGPGRRPVPFREFIVKLHSRCNLACDYCYVYRSVDQGWRAQPAVMTRETARLTARRIAEHAHTHGLPDVHVVFHGGEPLLAGPALITDVVTMIRREAGPGTDVLISVQTNGVLLDEAFLDVLAALDVGVSVSLDGARAGHDRHRRFRDGRGSFQAVADALGLLGASRHRRLFRGLLCTVDLDQDPVEVHRALCAFRPPVIDFLLPHGNWSHRPPGRPADSTSTPYADWLIAAFDEWYDSPAPETTVRIFQEIMFLLLGWPSDTETVGLSPAALVVVETDGTLEQSDVLKSAFPGAAATGRNVRDHSFDDVLRHPGVVERQLGLAALAGTCLRCEVVRVCGGGFYPHRYRAGTGFRNPSVYCPDLLRLIGHIRRRLVDDVAGIRRMGPAGPGAGGAERAVR